MRFKNQILKKIVLIFFIIPIVFSSCKKEINPDKETKSRVNKKETKKVDEKYLKFINVIEPFFEPLGEPEPDEWLASFKEDGQTFEQYM